MATWRAKRQQSSHVFRPTVDEASPTLTLDELHHLLMGHGGHLRAVHLPHRAEREAVSQPLVTARQHSQAFHSSVSAVCENLDYSVPFLDTSLDCCTTWGDEDMDSDINTEQKLLVCKGVYTNKALLSQVTKINIIIYNNNELMQIEQMLCFLSATITCSFFKWHTWLNIINTLALH